MWDRRWRDHHDVPTDAEHLKEIMHRPQESKFFKKALPDLETKVTHLNEGCADLKKQL
jgi:hypothetical protein